MIADRYYFGKLTDGEKTVYKELYQDIKKGKSIVKTVPIPRNQNIVMRIWNAVCRDNSRLFYYDFRQVQWTTSDSDTTFTIDYPFSQNEIVSFQKSIQQRALTISGQVIAKAGDDEEKREQALYEYFIKRYAYDTASLKTTDDKRFFQAHTLLGVFTDGTAVCEGLAKAFKFLLNVIDMKCIIITGNADWIYKDDEVGHAWNIVRINGKNYHTDVTCGITISHPPEFTNYAYLNLSDESIRIDHEGFQDVPACTNDDLEFFKNVAEVINNKIYLKNFIKDALKERKQYIDFMLVRGDDRDGITDAGMADPKSLVRQAIEKAHMEYPRVGFSVELQYISKRLTFGVDFKFK